MSVFGWGRVCYHYTQTHTHTRTPVVLPASNAVSVPVSSRQKGWGRWEGVWPSSCLPWLTLIPGSRTYHIILPCQKSCNKCLCKQTVIAIIPLVSNKCVLLFKEYKFIFQSKGRQDKNTYLLLACSQDGWCYRVWLQTLYQEFNLNLRWNTKQSFSVLSLKEVINAYRKY